MKENYNKVKEIDLKDDDPIAETKKIEPRANFHPQTIIELYKSVGGLCSKCRRYTIARNPITQKYISIGEAAHIYGARRSLKSPRPNFEMTDEELSHFNNGIWLCRNCHRQIDYDQDFFDSDILKKMKENAEQRAYDLLNKDIDNIIPINYEIFDLSFFSKFQLCLIHSEIKLNNVNFDFSDNYREFLIDLQNNPLYTRHVPITEDDTDRTTDFRWGDCWDSFRKFGIGNGDNNGYSLNQSKLLLVIYKNFSHLLKEPPIEKEIQNLIPDVIYLSPKDVDLILYNKLENYDKYLENILEQFIVMLENKIKAPL